MHLLSETANDQKPPRKDKLDQPTLADAEANHKVQEVKDPTAESNGSTKPKPKSVKTAEEINAQHVAKGNDPPYMEGTQVIEREASVGEQYSMVIDDKQKKMIENGETRIGGWASPEAPANQSIARNELAIRPEYKPDLPYVAKIEVIKPGAIVREGIAGPQGDLLGGGKQIELVMPPPQRAEYFKVIDISPLPGNK